MKIAHSLIKQLQAEMKIIDEKEERVLLHYVTELIVDMIIVNEQQAKTGNAELSKLFIKKIGTNN